MSSHQMLSRGGLIAGGAVLAALLVVSLPLLAFLAVTLRAGLLLTVAVLLVAGVVAYPLSATFREMVAATFGMELRHRGLRLSGDVNLDQAHSWTRFDGKDAIVGTDDLLPAVLGPAERVDLPLPGSRVQRGEPLFRIHHGNRSVAVPAPLDGVVTRRHEALAEHASMLSEDPYRRGWVVRVRPDDKSEARSKLLHGRHARAWFREEVDRLIDLLLTSGPVPTLPDGGALADGIHRHVDEPTWHELKQRFFEDWS